MKRGEIYFANLDPTIGDEIQKKRPVLIVSNDANNTVASTITIVPITSNVKKVYPFEILLEITKTGLAKTSKAQCHQVRTISKKRISDFKSLGMVDNVIMTKINFALKLHLNLR
ncbi:MAG: MazF family transcriptional regulator [Legionellales bacterium RIFCSPHIGHO2_12_FULL_42_9]|nr:MAG: MazF family transcriptional regulator [Legionellales bacterium RIFCSPHIGHO2_12_FULL_42_9]